MSPKPLLLVRYRLAGGLMDEVLERCDVRFLDGARDGIYAAPGSEPVSL